LKLAKYALRFFRQSVIAGLDVAWRALDPRMPLQPGFITYRTQLPQGRTLYTFYTVSSLLPGTLPTGTDASGSTAIHCLDVTQPIARQLAEEEALFAEALGEGRSDA
jgi:multicomponent Na+:H+ antiporter subunit E